jgi:hypothetical protein
MTSPLWSSVIQMQVVPNVLILTLSLNVRYGDCGLSVYSCNCLELCCFVPKSRNGGVLKVDDFIHSVIINVFTLLSLLDIYSHKYNRPGKLLKNKKRDNINNNCGQDINTIE